MFSSLFLGTSTFVNPRSRLNFSTTTLLCNSRLQILSSYSRCTCSKIYLAAGLHQSARDLSCTAHKKCKRTARSRPYSREGSGCILAITLNLLHQIFQFPPVTRWAAVHLATPCTTTGEYAPSARPIVIAHFFAVYSALVQNLGDWNTPQANPPRATAQRSERIV